MNDRTFETSAAMNDMDDALISEAVNAAKPKRTGIRWIAAAAAVVLVAGAAIALPKLLKRDSGEVSALLPTEEPYEEPAGDDPANGPIITEAAYFEVDATETGATEPADEPTETSAPGPQAVETNSFDSVVALNMAVRSGMNNEINGPLNGLGFIYMPTKVPYGAELSDITVDEEKVVLTYAISEEWWIDEHDPNRFVLIWFRNWASGSAESFAGSLYNESGSSFYGLSNADGEYIFAVNGGSERVGVWEQDGYGFEVIAPGAYCEDSDIKGFSSVVKVELGNVDVHVPSVGFVVDGYMWLSDNGMGYAPLTVLAYSTVYSEQDGVMLRTEGREFLDCITDDMRSYEGLCTTFPQVGFIFKPVLLDDTEIVDINVYGITDLDPIALGISLYELYDIAKMHVDEELVTYIGGYNRGCVLVDMVIEHRGNYVPELDDYEVEAYHCGFIIACGG